MDAIADVNAFDTLRLGMEEFVEGTGQSLAGLLIQLEKIKSFSGSSSTPSSTGGGTPPINPSVITDTAGNQNNQSALSDIVTSQTGVGAPFSAGMTPKVISVINNYNIEQASADQQAQRVAELTQRATRNGLRFL